MKHGGVFDPDKIKKSIEDLEKESFSEGFWNNRDNSEKVMSQLNKLKKRITPWETLVSGFDDMYELFINYPDDLFVRSPNSTFELLQELEQSQLDDLNESLGSIGKLMLFGVLLMYAILGTQFKSYFEPLMILMTVPMAFTGVVVGLLVTQNPLSLFTLYGVVALAGIAVNAAIVLISTANQRLSSGMSVVHASIYAARRRVVPILITSLTTVAGLFSLAVGLGGKSLLWGPVATAIVWGLAVSTVLTLLLVPVIYRIFISDKKEYGTTKNTTHRSR